MIIMGIDPGLRHTAYGVIDYDRTKLNFISCGTISPYVKDSMPSRLAHIFNNLQHIIGTITPSLTVVEESFVSANPQTSLKLGQARAMALLAPALNNIEVMELAPRDIKKSVTGSGKADKQQIQVLVKTLLPAMQATNEHEVDALAIAIAGSHYHATLSRIP